MQKKHERKKRYGWLIGFALINWLLISLMILMVEPESVRHILFENSYLPMMILLGGGFFWFFSIILMSAKKALMWTVGILIFLYLKVWGMGNLINAGLIFGILTSIEIYNWSEKKQHEKETGEKENQLA